MNLIKGITCALLGALPLSVFAGGAGEMPTFGTLDVDRSGDLSPQELEAYPDLAAHFNVADADTDGSLSAAEFTALVSQPESGSSVE
jgi:hypothetical protein